MEYLRRFLRAPSRNQRADLQRRAPADPFPSPPCPFTVVSLEMADGAEEDPNARLRTSIHATRGQGGAAVFRGSAANGELF
jgi:hypothetical protein